MSTNRMSAEKAAAAVRIAIEKAKRIGDVPCHQVAAMFPLIDGDDWQAFKTDLVANGLRNPIIIDHFGKVIDGRNRVKAIIELRQERKQTIIPRFQCLNFGPAGRDDDNITKYIISANLARRQLTTSQRIAIAADLANLAHGGDRRPEQGSDLNLDPGIKPMTITKAAETMKVSKSGVKKYYAEKVKDKNPEAHDQVKAGKMTAEAAIKETKAKAGKKAPAPERETRKERQELLQKSVDALAEARGITRKAEPEKVSEPKGEYWQAAISKESPEVSIVPLIDSVRTLDGLDRIASAVAARREQLAKVPS